MADNWMSHCDVSIDDLGTKCGRPAVSVQQRLAAGAVEFSQLMCADHTASYRAGLFS